MSKGGVPNVEDKAVATDTPNVSQTLAEMMATTLPIDVEQGSLIEDVREQGRRNAIVFSTMSTAEREEFMERFQTSSDEKRAGLKPS